MTPETHVFKEADGCSIKLDVYAPAGPDPAPLIVWIHGGALIGGSRLGMHGALRQRLHEAGFAQASIDYRLAPETKLPEILSDVRDAFAWLRDEGPRRWPIVPDRIGVMGHSAGGYLTLMCGSMIEPRPRALVSFYGYGDIVGDWYGKPDPFYCQEPAVPKEKAYACVNNGVVTGEGLGPERGSFYLYCRQNGLWPKEVAGIDHTVNPDAFTPWCPERNVDATYPPTLLLHGTADTEVPYYLSDRMAGILETANIPHEFITIPNGPHGFDGAVTEPDLHAEPPGQAAGGLLRALAFLEKHV
jgi:acetyl esterase/lipase